MYLRPTRPRGLYDPANEHDACGIGFVANIKGQQVPRHHPQRDPDPDQPHAPRRLRLRSGDRRRRGRPDPDSARVLRPRVRKARLHAAGSGRIRRGHGLPSGGTAAAAAERRYPGADRPRGRPHGAGLARHADRRDAIGRWRAPRSLTSSRSSSARARAWARRNWSASSTWSASAPKRKSPPPTSRTRRSSTSRRSRRGPSCTRGCCWRRRSRTSISDLSDPDAISALCLVHQRFSTNTFPTWQLAHPFRYICHNGEINTLRGNVNWMHARQIDPGSPLFGDDIKKLFPVIAPGGSDSAMFDNAVELLYAGRPQPAARHGDADPGGLGRRPTMHPDKRAFYEYHASLMEPWDGRRRSPSPTAASSAPRWTATACARRASW